MILKDGFAGTIYSDGFIRGRRGASAFAGPEFCDGGASKSRLAVIIKAENAVGLFRQGDVVTFLPKFPHRVHEMTNGNQHQRISSDPTIELPRLRHIGWTEWDPIGLLSVGQAWEHHPAADEYDRYLLEAAGGLRRDWSISDAADYLMGIASEHMGLGHSNDWSARTRAEATATAIKAYLDELMVRRY